MYDFKNKIVVITGAARGIGHKIATDFKACGANVAIIDQISCETIFDYAYEGDISNESILEDFATAVITRYGKIDCLINNACVSKGGLYDASYDDFLYVQKVGVLAPFILSKCFTPYFNHNGTIVNIASTRAFQSQENTECYSAAKGGLISLTHALAVSLKGKVRVNAISPGWIDAQDMELSKEDHVQHLVGRVGRPDDISHTVLFLCSEQAGFITGENIIIDGGMSKLMIYHNEHGWKYES